MFGVCRYVHTLKAAIEKGEKEIQISAHTGEGTNNDNSVMVMKELLDAAGYKFASQKYSLLRGSRVLTYSKN